MKNMKKFFSLVLAIVMVMALAAPVMAADEAVDGSGTAVTATTYTLTINNTVVGHTYEAYQVFSGDLAGDVLANIKWGSGVKNTDALLAAINTKFTAEGTDDDFADAAAVANWLGKNVSSDSVTLDAFADLVGDYLNTPAGTSSFDGTKYTISGLPAGYYLIKDQAGSQDEKPDAYTKYILRVLKDQIVTPKSDTTKVNKTINDILTGTFTEHEDFDITDTAYYKLEGTLPSNLAAYDTYFYEFVDTLPVGIDTDVNIAGKYYGVQQIYIEGHDGNVVHTFYDVTDADTTNDTLPEGITVTPINGVYVRDENGKIITDSPDNTAEQLKVTFNNLKALYKNLLPTHKIVVKYSAFVNRDALISAYGKFNAMENKVYLRYSNEPNGDGIGKTEDDVAYAFTFRFNVDKYDADNHETKLEGAEFKLYYVRVEDGAQVKHYAQVITEEMIYKVDKDTKELLVDKDGNYILRDDAADGVGIANPTLDDGVTGVYINGKKLMPANLGNIFAWTTDETHASILDTDKNGHLSVGGLDEGIYYLEETKAPSGYNLMETPVQIVIKPTYDATTGKLTAVNYEVDSIAQPSDTVGIRNDAGSTLPQTGGMGTTLFYVFGSIMVVGATVLLITKKRMAA